MAGACVCEPDIQRSRLEDTMHSEEKVQVEMIQQNAPNSDIGSDRLEQHPAS